VGARPLRVPFAILLRRLRSHDSYSSVDMAKLSQYPPCFPAVMAIPSHFYRIH